MDEEIKKLVEENLRLTKEIHEMTRKIGRYITFQKIVSVFYILLIVIPLILSFIYLPPLLGGVMNQYKELLGDAAGIDNLSGSVQNLNPDELLKLINR